MKKMIWLIPAICLISLQCEKNDPASRQYNFTGTWEFDKIVEGIHHYNRVAEFGDEYGFTIYEDGRFLEHKNGGWCATPPISFADFEGDWIQVSDSILLINVDFWGGVEIYELKIFDATENTLQTKRTTIETTFSE